MRLTRYLFFILLACGLNGAADHIQVNKGNVLHSFIRDPSTDDFVEKAFQNWEPETFEVFEKCKDKEGVAIDLGAWIGTTSIWLSHNFHHVIAVECDSKSLECLFSNLLASGCSNVSICDRPVAQFTDPVIFGPRYGDLNLSTSCIKQVSDNQLDYLAKSITFKQLLFDYVYSDKEVSSKRVSFIKCDIEGGEENILEDLLYFAHHNSASVYVSFHLSWWQSHEIYEFDDLFSFFSICLPNGEVIESECVTEYLFQNPFASLLFLPICDGSILIKKDMPVLIIAYNLVTFVRNMVDQLQKYTSDIMIVDNCSNFQPLLDYYQNEYRYTLFREDKNFGHRVYLSETMQKLLGDVYIVTDPDLQFNEKLPYDFIRKLLKIQNYMTANRVGFALGIGGDDFRTDSVGKSALEWEKIFWMKRVEYSLDPTLELYEGGIDTTFCLINRVFEKKYPYFAIRVAGDFTCKHLPWYQNFDANFLEGEYESYMNKNVSTNYFRKD